MAFQSHNESRHLSFIGRALKGYRTYIFIKLAE